MIDSHIRRIAKRQGRRPTELNPLKDEQAVQVPPPVHPSGSRKQGFPTHPSLWPSWCNCAFLFAIIIMTSSIIGFSLNTLTVESEQHLRRMLDDQTIRLRKVQNVTEILQEHPLALSNYSHLPHLIRSQTSGIQVDLDGFWRFADLNMCHSMKLAMQATNCTHWSLLHPILDTGRARAQVVLDLLIRFNETLGSEIARIAKASDSLRQDADSLCKSQSNTWNMMNLRSGDGSGPCKTRKCEHTLAKSLERLLDQAQYEIVYEHIFRWQTFLEDILTVYNEMDGANLCEWPKARLVSIEDSFVVSVSRLRVGPSGMQQYRLYYDNLCRSRSSVFCNMETWKS